MGSGAGAGAFDARLGMGGIGFEVFILLAIISGNHNMEVERLFPGDMIGA